VAHEISRARKWIYDALKADGTLAALIGGASNPRIYFGQAPEKAVYPFVLFNLQAASDVQGLCLPRVATSPVFQVKVICDGPPSADVRTIADRIDLVLGQAVTQISESYVFSGRRIQPLEYIEPKRDSSSYYTHSGGLYRLLVYPQ
jgi:hypothetical protein